MAFIAARSWTLPAKAAYDVNSLGLDRKRLREVHAPANPLAPQVLALTSRGDCRGAAGRRAISLPVAGIAEPELQALLLRQRHLRLWHVAAEHRASTDRLQAGGFRLLRGTGHLRAVL